MSTEKKVTIGVIGLGHMGSVIAANLVKSGFDVIGTDIVAERRAELAQAGGTAVADAPEVGRRCRRIILSLPSERALQTVSTELAASCVRGTIVMEAGTRALKAKMEARDRLNPQGIILLDSTLSGTSVQARNRDLAVYASGDSAAIEQMRPIIDGFARVCYDLGEFGNGTKMKFVANLLVGVHTLAAAEAVLFGVRSGLDPATVVKVIADGAGGSRMLQVRGPVMANRDWEKAAATNTDYNKTMNLIAEAVQAAGTPAPLFAACMPIYVAARASGHAEHDMAAVYEILERMALNPDTKN